MGRATRIPTAAERRRELSDKRQKERRIAAVTDTSSKAKAKRDLLKKKNDYGVLPALMTRNPIKVAATRELILQGKVTPSHLSLPDLIDQYGNRMPDLSRFQEGLEASSVSKEDQVLYDVEILCVALKKFEAEYPRMYDYRDLDLRIWRQFIERIALLPGEELSFDTSYIYNDGLAALQELPPSREVAECAKDFAIHVSRLPTQEQSHTFKSAITTITRVPEPSLVSEILCTCVQSLKGFETNRDLIYVALDSIRKWQCGRGVQYNHSSPVWQQLDTRFGQEPGFVLKNLVLGRVHVIRPACARADLEGA